MTAPTDVLVLDDPVRVPILSLRSVGVEAARLQSRLSRVREPINITAGGAQIYLGLDAPRKAAPDVPWLHLTIDSAPAAIQLPWGMARRLTGLTVEGAIPEDIGLIMEDALEAALDQAEALTGLTLRFIAMRETADDLPIQTTLNIQGKDAGGRFVQMRQAVTLSAEAAQALLSGIEPREIKRQDLPGLALRIAWEIDAITLSLGDFQALEVGDAIAMSAPGAHRRLILENKLFAHGEAVANGIALLGSFSLQALKKELGQMSEEALGDKIERPALKDADLDEVEVRLSFRTGEVQLPLRELRGLAPGSIIETGDPATMEVEIVANGRTVGSGELIEVGGKRAVQIRRLFTGH